MAKQGPQADKARSPHIDESGAHLTEAGLWRTGPVWLAGERRLARWVGRPVATFLRVEAAGGILLLIATVAALVWANSPWAGSYEALWATEFSVGLGDWTITEDLRHWVNDLLMALFFFVVGLEIKHEIVAGELRQPRVAAVPVIAAIGGMVVPAGLYAMLNVGGEGAAGWGIPMATDIAFALGVVAVLGKRVPVAARIFLLTLAIVDDIGAITVIAVFYTDDLAVSWLLAALAAVLAIVALRRVRVWSMSAYVPLAAFLWLATYLSGVHATIAGVVLGLLTPAQALLDQASARRYVEEDAADEITAEELRRLQFLLAESVPVAERLEKTLHPWSSYVVLPIFALANAGIALGGGVLGEALTSPVAAGVVLGLVVGKPAGILLATWVAVRLRIGSLPAASGWLTVAGAGALAGIGFTVSLFIAGLAFEYGSPIVADAKVGILVGSVVSAALGAGLLLAASRRTPDELLVTGSPGASIRPPGAPPPAPPG